MSEKTAKIDTSRTAVQNPLLKKILTFDDFSQQALLAPAAPPIEPPKEQPHSAPTGSPQPAVVGQKPDIDISSFSEISLNSVTEEEESQPFPGTIQTDLPSTGQEESILSQAASSFSQLPSVASTVFSTFSRVLNNYSPQAQNQNQNQANRGENTNNFQVPTPLSDHSHSPYLGPPTFESTSSTPSIDPYSNYVPEPPRLYSAAEVAPTPTPPSQLPPSGAGGLQNSYRLSAKKKTYAPVPGLSVNSATSPDAFTTPSFDQQIPLPSSTVNEPIQPNLTSPQSEVHFSAGPPPPQSQPTENKGGLFSFSNFVPPVWQNVTGLVQASLTGTRPTPPPPPETECSGQYLASVDLSPPPPSQGFAQPGFSPPQPSFNPVQNFSEFPPVAQQHQVDAPPKLPPAAIQGVGNFRLQKGTKHYKSALAAEHKTTLVSPNLPAAEINFNWGQNQGLNPQTSDNSVPIFSPTSESSGINKNIFVPPSPGGSINNLNTNKSNNHSYVSNFFPPASEQPQLNPPELTKLLQPSVEVEVKSSDQQIEDSAANSGFIPFQVPSVPEVDQPPQISGQIECGINFQPFAPTAPPATQIFTPFPPPATVVDNQTIQSAFKLTPFQAQSSEESNNLVSTFEQFPKPPETSPLSGFFAESQPVSGETKPFGNELNTSSSFGFVPVQPNSIPSPTGTIQFSQPAFAPFQQLPGVLQPFQQSQPSQVFQQSQPSPLIESTQQLQQPQPIQLVESTKAVPSTQPLPPPPKSGFTPFPPLPSAGLTKQVQQPTLIPFQPQSIFDPSQSGQNVDQLPAANIGFVPILPQTPTEPSKLFQSPEALINTSKTIGFEAFQPQIEIKNTPPINPSAFFTPKNVPELPSDLIDNQNISQCVLVNNSLSQQASIEADKPLETTDSNLNPIGNFNKPTTELTLESYTSKAIVDKNLNPIIPTSDLKLRTDLVPDNTNAEVSTPPTALIEDIFVQDLGAHPDNKASTPVTFTVTESAEVAVPKLETFTDAGSDYSGQKQSVLSSQQQQQQLSATLSTGPNTVPVIQQPTFNLVNYFSTNPTLAIDGNLTDSDLNKVNDFSDHINHKPISTGPPQHNQTSVSSNFFGSNQNIGPVQTNTNHLSFFDSFRQTNSIQAPQTDQYQQQQQQQQQLKDDDTANNLKIQDFFNNPPQNLNQSAAELNYNLVCSGLAVNQRNTLPIDYNPNRAPSPLSNIVEPPSSSCSEFSAEVSAYLDRATNDESFSTLNRTEQLDQIDMAAANSNAGIVEYSPVVRHWFYKKSMDSKQIWSPFSYLDSNRIEEAFLAGDHTTPLPVEGGRYEVSIAEKTRQPIYWSEKSTEIRRCCWFYKAIDSRYTPYEETEADLLEEEYRRACESGEWHRKITLPSGEKVDIHSPTVMVHYLQSQVTDAWGTTPQTTGRPRIVRRDIEEFTIEEGETDKVDHLLFMVHGIGSACDLKFRPVEEVVEEFRSIAYQLVQAHYKNSRESGQIGRVEVLPVSWHSELHSEESGIDQKLKAITLESIPKLRNFANDTLLDVLFYTSPVFCQSIMDTVAGTMNKVYLKYCQRNPNFNGSVSLAGHSLGSLILFDLLCHQKSTFKETDIQNSENPDQVIKPLELCPQSLQCSTTTSKQISYTMGPAGTGQPFINYPQLLFAPKKFFALGSPIGMFVMIRGIDMLGLDFKLPTCPGFYNIFHPYDPVAYRIEALVNSELATLRPVLIPHHKGRKRMHLELKETMTRVGADLKQKIFDTFKNTMANVYLFGVKAKPDPQEIEKEVDKVLDMQLEMDKKPRSRQNSTSTPSDIDNSETDLPLGNLNESRRIDYVLQEAPLEFFNEYLFALTSHVCYWESADTILFMMKEIYSHIGVNPDREIPQQGMTIERPTTSKNHQYLLSPTRDDRN